jgi:hypothetical protein
VQDTARRFFHQIFRLTISKKFWVKDKVLKSSNDIPCVYLRKKLGRHETTWFRQLPGTGTYETVQWLKLAISNYWSFRTFQNNYYCWESKFRDTVFDNLRKILHTFIDAENTHSTYTHISNIIWKYVQYKKQIWFLEVIETLYLLCP